MKCSLRLSFFALPFLFLLPLTASAALPSCTLRANPTSITQGQSTTLTWSSLNAATGSISGIGNVPLVGSITGKPQQTTTYVGTFSGGGAVASCFAKVSVFIPPPTQTTGSTGGSTGSTPGSTGGCGANPTPGAPCTTTNTTPSGSPGDGGLIQKAAPTVFGPEFQGPSAPVASAPTQTLTTPTGLVPCNGLDCQACHVAEAVNRVIKFLLAVAIPIAALMFGWAGVLYFTSGANPGNKERGRKIFVDAFVGFAIALAAFLIVNTLMHTLIDTTNYLQEGSWFTIKCVPTANRPMSGTVNDLLNSALPGLTSVNQSQDRTYSDLGTPLTKAVDGQTQSDTGARTTFSDYCSVNLGTPECITVSSTGNCADPNNKSCTSLTGLTSASMAGVETIAGNCGCKLNISGGTETGHGTGVYSHAGGDKLDFSFSPQLNSYITTGATDLGKRGDGAQQYQLAGTNTVCAKENNHWDCTFK